MVGTSLGPYKILEKIGAGGMGEVYLAEDTRLNRKVAVKVLPAEFASDPERLARFEQEARAAAALNHPHIAAVFDVGSATTGATEGTEGSEAAARSITTHYMVQEYLEGQSLRQRLDQGTMPLDEALDLSVEVGEALIAAHAAGIVHRDLKPDNIFITTEGHAKVLDFGLAKLTEMGPGAGAADLSMSPTMLGTVAGQVMGTAGYMAPEQVEGGEVDRRTDIFGFGCVVYEMVSGRQPFAGRTVHHTLDRVLSEEPTPVRDINRALPHQLQWILQKCLAKPPAHRYQHADDLVVDFVALRKELESGPSGADEVGTGVPAEPPAVGSRLLVAALGVIAVAAMATAAWGWLRPANDTAVLQRFELLLGPPGEYVTLAEANGRSVAIAPDASRVVWVADGPGGTMLYVRELDSFVPRPIPGTEGGDMPFFSPDSRQVGFFAGRTLKKVGFTGARPSELADVGANVRGADWGEDGRIIIGHSDDPGLTHGLTIVSDTGGDLRVLVEAPAGDSYRYPQFLPGGNTVLLTVEGSEEGVLSSKTIAVYTLATDNLRHLAERGTHARYTSSGHLVYGRGMQLAAVPFDLDTLEAVGDEVVVIGDLHVNSNLGYAHFDVSEDGTLVYAEARSSRGILSWVTRDGTESHIFPEPRGIATPRISPDGTRVAWWQSENETESIWIYDVLRGGEAQQLTPGSEAFSPEWLNDRSIIYGGRDANNPGSYATLSIDTSFTGDPVVLPIEITEAGDDDAAITFSYDHYSVHPDGSPITLTLNETFWLYSLETGLAERFSDAPGSESVPAFSPDGNWLAFVSDQEGPRHVYVTSYPEGEQRRKISIAPAGAPTWSANSREIYFLQGRTMMAVAFDPETGDYGPPTRLFDVRSVPGPYRATNYDVAENGDFLMLLGTDATVTTELKVVLNWFEELRELAPAGGAR